MTIYFSNKTHRPIRRAVFLSVLAASILNFTIFPVQADNDAEPQIKRGEKIYNRFCSALCHKKNMEGQANWRKRKPDGKLPAPPHDETGHTWHHADALLFGIIKQGLVPPFAPPNYKSDMPAWGGTLSDSDIHAVIAYIKSRWPKETRKIQAEINAEALQRQR
ncbi:MAG: cytochrome c [Gammaproteobacteria bacterium]|nr:cytochrome c [Gammaproteobacteria bacterium]